MDPTKMDMRSFMFAMSDPSSPVYIPKFEFEMVPFKGLKNGVKTYKGHLLPMVCRNPTMLKQIDVRESDTFVVTFPKSGTHWVSEIIWLLQNDLNFEKAHSIMHMIRAPFIDMGLPNGFLSHLPDPRVFMTHFSYELLPDDLNKKAKIVYVTRNPKDVLVSLFYFLKSIPDDEYEGTVEDLYENFIKGESIYGPWWDHVNMYTQLENVHVVAYEDLQDDPINEVKAIAKYLGKEYSDDQIKAVVDFCSFDKLKNSPAFEVKMRPGDLAKGIMDLKIDENKSETEAKSEVKPEAKKMKELKIFRKGEVGDWKNYFSEEMSKRLEEVLKAKLTYKKPFKYELSAKKSE